MQTTNWIKGKENCIFKKVFSVKENLVSAKLYITAMGVYEANINGGRIGDYVLAPGWTSYKTRLQYQQYDITDMLKEDNTLTVWLGNGWYMGSITYVEGRHTNIWNGEPAIIAKIVLDYGNESETIITDESWLYSDSNIKLSEIYDGETYDASYVPESWANAEIFDGDKEKLIPQQGPIIKEHERIKPVSVIKTPKGETVIDFGQNLTGYIEFTVDANSGDKIVISHGEVLDKEGNFYTENLRSAKQLITYICTDGKQTYKPKFTFMGFRYIRLDEFPIEPNPDDFTAIAVHSDMKRTGYFECSNSLVNQLFHNIIWGQKGNFLDVPTDCPQRDERLGWTGDAQVFVKTASYNYDVNSFFEKWLADLAADQYEDGCVPHVIPDALQNLDTWAASFGWADAAVICPWQIYLTYNNKEILEKQFDSMEKWVNYAGEHLDSFCYGDWLAMDYAEDSYQGSSNKLLINNAFYCYSTSLLIKAGKVIGKDVTKYEKLYKNIVDNFRNQFELKTQTEYAQALFFDLVENKEQAAKNLAELVINNGNKLTTGFLGTPYLLHALSRNGYSDVAYSLLLQEEYPSWLFSVKQGATTIWEHWDGIKPDGSFWSKDMNSYNHYAYGAVADWMYEVAAGINIDEAKPGFEHIILKPVADSRLKHVAASIDTPYGVVSSRWEHIGGKTKYNFTVPSSATIILGGISTEVKRGEYEFII